MKIRHFSVSVAGFACLLGAAFALVSVIAPPVQAEAGQAFSISKPVIELSAKPGETVTATIKFTNISAGDLIITPQYNDFGAKDESGDPKILPDDAQTTTYSLKSWITAMQPFRIASKETRMLDFPIHVPASAEPGGHYAVIRFTGTAPDLTQSGVGYTGSIGSLVLLQVAGDIKENASLIEFSPAAVGHDQNGNPTYKNASFFEFGPVGFIARIKNTGNVHVKPTGTIDIYNTFGAKVATLRVNGDPTDPKNPPKSALPQSVRRFGETGPDNWMFGHYTAKLTLSYGQGQQQLTKTIDFWVIPYKLILFVIALGVGLYFLGRNAIRRYNEHIINKATAAQAGSKKAKTKKQN